MTRFDTHTQLKMSFAKKKNAFNTPNLLIILAWPRLVVVTILISLTKRLTKQLKGGRISSGSG